jgi:hypothetical protein
MSSIKNINASDILGKESEDFNRLLGTKAQVANFVRKYPEGVSVRMVADHIGISYNRAKEILDELVLKRDLYHRKIPNSINLYYPNGKLIHKYLQESKEVNNQIFRLSFHEGRFGPRMQIQERKFSLLDGEQVEGSIFIDVNNIAQFKEFLDEMLNKFNSFTGEA